MSRAIPSLVAIALALAVSACGQGAPGLADGAASQRRMGVPGGPRAIHGPIAARSAGDEAGLIRAAALEAHATILEADAAYKALGLNTAAGRKLTPQREPVVREGLKPLVARLDAATAAIAGKLAPEGGSAKLATLRQAFEDRAPRPGEAMAPDAAATTLIHRVAQYRLKLSFLVEYALRRGIVAELPLPAPAPSAPGPAPSGEDPGATP